MGVNIRISVRNLVEFLLRSGDIDRRTERLEQNAMEMGRKIHRKIQKAGGPAYHAEVPLSDTTDFPEDGFSLTVEGRADGIMEDEDGVMVDEIKGMFRDVAKMNEPLRVHLAQAKCYAVMIRRKMRENPDFLKEAGTGTSAGKGKVSPQKKAPAKVHGNVPEKIRVRLTYVNLDTEEVRRMTEAYSADELESWYRDLLSRYRRWAVVTVRHLRKRTDSVRKMKFPYPYREGQRRLVASVYRTIEQKKKLFIQAPTGSGKTLAVVFPAVKAVGEGLSDRVFYLTARTVTRTVAEDSFRILQREGLDFRTLTITSKEKVCPILSSLREKEEEAVPPCSPDACPYAKGHFDRVNGALYELLTGGNRNILRRENILKAALEHQVCPYELTLDLTDWADGIICDYNYVFDPTAKLGRFFGTEKKGNSVFLIDEAHNLVDRGRDMYSADLYREEFLTLRRTLRAHRLGQGVQKNLSACLRYLLAEKKQVLRDPGTDPGTDAGPGSGYRVTAPPDTFRILLSNLAVSLGNFLEDSHSVDMTEQTQRFYFRVLDFADAWDRFTEKYRMTEREISDGRFQVRIVCLDPSGDLGLCMDRGRSSILFSATLLPIAYYRSLLAGKPEDYAVYASSAFDPSRRAILIGRDVSTRYRDRKPETYRKIAAYIREVVTARAGNYMVFFSSYRMMEDTFSEFDRICPSGVRTIVQNNHMSEEEREKFLEKFSSEEAIGQTAGERTPGTQGTREEQETNQNTESEKTKVRAKDTLVGFCVMGSFFAEGIDLKGERLIGAIVVGTGIPQVGPEREILKDYFDSRSMDGFFYSYTCPGMAKVLQAAGRVIRTEEDRGVVVLIDERFSRPDYRSMFPREWADAGYVTLDRIHARLEQFWKT